MTSYILTFFVFILIIGILVFVHELGHFMLARRAGMKVEEFGIGLPPRLREWKKFGTLVTLNAIPIGGFVKVKGGDKLTVTKEDLEDPESYHSKTWFQRFWFIIAGVIMNFILAFVIISIGYMSGMTPLPGSSLYEDSQTIKGIVINKVMEGSPAQKAGIEPGDFIISINGSILDTPEDLSKYIKAHADSVLDITIERNKLIKNINVRPGKDKKIGVAMSLMIELEKAYLYPHKAIYHAFLSTVFITKETFKGIVMVFFNLLTQFSIPDEVSGPVGIVSITHQVTKVGFMSVLQFMAILSISLGVINIFPFPALDGGRLIFLVIEGITRKRVDSKFEGLAHIIGFLMLMLLIVLVTYKDIMRLIF